MAHTERQRAIDPNAPPADLTHDEVRRSFMLRLWRERDDLAALSQPVNSISPAPEVAYRNLEQFAHRLRGAAAVFGYVDVRDCAKDLEFAAKADASRIPQAVRDLNAQLTRAIEG